jgi:hypothetical protein
MVFKGHFFPLFIRLYGFIVAWSRKVSIYMLNWTIRGQRWGKQYCFLSALAKRGAF